MSQQTGRMDLPVGSKLVRSTPRFDELTTPAGLRSAHRIADGVWGRLVVTSGHLDFVFEEPEPSRRTLGDGDVQIIAPGRHHHVELTGPVGFHIEFHRAG